MQHELNTGERSLLALALRVPFDATGAHPNKVFYESPFAEENGQFQRFQVCVYFKEYVQIHWDNRILGEKSWSYQKGFGFYGNPALHPALQLFERVMYFFGCETTFSAHEKLELEFEKREYQLSCNTN